MKSSNSNNDKKTLAQRTHWKKFRELLESLSRIENVHLSDYNSKDICCYTCLGDELLGVNVKFQTNGGMSCWVDDNTYDVYEIPAYSNTSKMCGEFLYLAHNVSFDYWLFGEMTYRINRGKTAANKTLYETAYYIPYGAYTLYDENNITTIKKTVTGKHLTYGGYVGRNNYSFDHLGRRKAAYNTSHKKEVNSITGRAPKVNVNKKKAVKIYKKKDK